jgi:hypothetical protein
LAAAGIYNFGCRSTRAQIVKLQAEWLGCAKTNEEFRISNFEELFGFTLANGYAA